jgi:hypothetical protein
MPAAALLRIVCLLLFAASSAACGVLLLQKQGTAAIKLGWVAALLLLFAADPTRLTPLGASPPALAFYRIAFAAVAALLFLTSVFIVFFIQLPHERIPHYSGRIIALIDGTSPKKSPEVEYRIDDGPPRVFVDRTAPLMYPRRQFRQNEAVSVIVVSPEHPRIDEPLLVRWSTAAVVLEVTTFMTSLAIICHIKYTAAVG